MRKRILMLFFAGLAGLALADPALADERRPGGHDRQHWRERGGDHWQGRGDRARGGGHWQGRGDHARGGDDWKDRGDHARGGDHWKERRDHARRHDDRRDWRDGWKGRSDRSDHWKHRDWRFREDHDHRHAFRWHAPDRKPWHRGFTPRYRGPVVVVPPHRFHKHRPDFVILPRPHRSSYFDRVRRYGYRPHHEVRRSSTTIVIRASDGFGIVFDLLLDSRSGSLVGRHPYRP